MCLCVHVYVCVHVCMYVHVCVYVCVHVCMYVHVCILGKLSCEILYQDSVPNILQEMVRRHSTIS